MTQIALLHKHYDQQHLEAVKAEMTTLGAPSVRAIWSEMYGLWLAVEGSHRLRAAADLGLDPIIIDVSDDETVVIEVDGYDEEVAVLDLLEELQDNAPHTEILTY